MNWKKIAFLMRSIRELHWHLKVEGEVSNCSRCFCVIADAVRSSAQHPSIFTYYIGSIAVSKCCEYPMDSGLMSWPISPSSCPVCAGSPVSVSQHTCPRTGFKPALCHCRPSSSCPCCYVIRNALKEQETCIKEGQNEKARPPRTTPGCALQTILPQQTRAGRRAELGCNGRRGASSALQHVSRDQSFRLQDPQLPEQKMEPVIRPSKVTVRIRGEDTSLEL